MDITHNLEINASVEQVYSAVATEKGINSWWSKEGKVGESEGENSLLKFNKQGNIVEMGFKTVELSPNKKVVWECLDNGNPAWVGTRIVTEIAESAEGSTVIFSHAGFDDKWSGQEPFEMTKNTWGHFVNSLKSYCEEGVGEPW